MVDPYDVVRVQRRLQARAPPGKAALFMRLPIVNGIAPKLPRFRKIVGRHARDEGGFQLVIELEKLAVRPNVGAVVRDVKRNIADDLDAEPVAIVF